MSLEKQISICKIRCERWNERNIDGGGSCNASKPTPYLLCPYFNFVVNISATTYSLQNLAIRISFSMISDLTYSLDWEIISSSIKY